MTDAVSAVVSPVNSSVLAFPIPEPGGVPPANARETGDCPAPARLFLAVAKLGAVNQDVPSYFC